MFILKTKDNYLYIYINYFQNKTLYTESIYDFFFLIGKCSRAFMTFLTTYIEMLASIFLESILRTLPQMRLFSSRLPRSKHVFMLRLTLRCTSSGKSPRVTTRMLMKGARSGEPRIACFSGNTL